MARRRRPPRSGALHDLSPPRLTLQIFLLQLVFYAALLLLTLSNTLISGFPFRPSYILSPAYLGLDTVQGLIRSLNYLLAGGPVLALGIVLLVSRSRFVLDFAITTHAIHFLLAWLCNGSVRPPVNPAFYLVLGASASLAVALGTWGCRFRELRSASFFGRRYGGVNGNGSALHGERDGSGIININAADDGDEELGSSRGRGRGRERDAAREYEMVRINGHGGRGEEHSER